MILHVNNTWDLNPPKFTADLDFVLSVGGTVDCGDWFEAPVRPLQMGLEIRLYGFSEQSTYFFAESPGSRIIMIAAARQSSGNVRRPQASGATARRSFMPVAQNRSVLRL